MRLKPEIFFSYAWGDETERGESRERIVNELYDSLNADGYNVKRDKYSVGYRQLFSEFMRNMGRGKFIVVAISDKYLKSPYCMYELLEIYRKSNSDINEMRGKIFPIILGDAKIHDPFSRLNYLDFWKAQKEELEKRINEVGLDFAAEVVEDFKIYREITLNISVLSKLLTDMNTLNPKILSAENFAEIKKAIESNLTDDGPANDREQPEPGANPKTGSENIHNAWKHDNHQSKKKIKKFLGAQPFFSETFLGREDDLKAIHQKLFEGNNLLLLVNGEGGIGKTTLAAQYYNRYQDEYQYLAWVFAGNSLADALLTLAIPLDINFPETMPAEERIWELLDVLRNSKKPCLLVIDNANDIKHLEDYYQALRRCANFHMLLTTRITAFEQAAKHKIEPLEKKAAFELFKTHYPNHLDTEDELLEKILIAVGYNTLATELLAKNLNNFNRLKTHYSLTDLLHELQEKGLLALTKTKAVSTSYHATGYALRKESIESILEAMYELSELTEKESALLSVFAVLPAESIKFDLLEILLPGREVLEQTLLTLAQKGWLDYRDDSASFKVSPVIQEIAKNKNPQLLVNCHGLLKRLMEKLDYEGMHITGSTYEEATLFARYAENLVNSFEQVDENLALLCDRLGAYQEITGNLDKALTFYEGYNRLKKELYEAYPQNVSFKNGLAISCEKLGSTQTALGNLDKALTFYEDETKLFEELYEAYPQNVSFKNGLAISYSKLGETQAALGNLDKALTFYEDETKLFQELYGAYPQNVSFKNGLAISYSKLGEMQAALGNLDKALTFYEERSRLGKELNEAYPQNVSFKNGLAISYSKLGETQAALGNPDKASTFYEDETKLFEELYEAYPQNVSFKNGLAISYSKLGETQASLGNLDKALTFYEERLRLGKELYEAYPQNVKFKNGLAISYVSLGLFYEQKQNRDRAKAYYQLSLEHFSELVSRFPAYAEFKKNLLEVQNKLEDY